MINTAATIMPVPQPTELAVIMGAGKAPIRYVPNALIDACANMAISTLPLVLLNTHVKMTALAVATTMNSTTSRRLPWGVSQDGTRTAAGATKPTQAPR